MMFCFFHVEKSRDRGREGEREGKERGEREGEEDIRKEKTKVSIITVCIISRKLYLFT